MKKILTFLFCLAVVYTNGQIYVQPNSTYGTQEYRRAILSTFHYPTGCGVPTDFTYLNEPGIKVRQNQAAIYYDSCGHHAYNWDPALRSWSLLGSGSGGGVDSIYNRTDSAFYRLNGVEEFAFLISEDTTNLSARIDTLSATIFAALALKVANFLGVSYVGYGTHSARPTSGTGLYYDTDSASFFRVNGASYTNLFPSFNVTVLGKGGPGDTTLVSASGGNLLVAAVRDSGCIVHVVNPDGSWTFYSFCALKNYWDSTAGKISPHGATDTVVMNRVVVNNRIDQTYTNATAGAFNQTGFNGTDRNNAIGMSGSTINGIRRAYTPNGATFNLDIYNAFIADLSGAPSATVNTGSGFTTLLSSSTNWGTQNGFSVTYGGGGINRRAFATNIPAGTGNYAFYSSADAPSLFGGAIGINQSAPNASALLDIVSTTKGILTPRMNTTQMLAITTPPGGLLVFNIDSTSSLTGGYYYYDGVTSAWRPLSKASGGGGGVSLANPTATIGFSAVNGSATTAMRSDAAPKIDTTVATGVIPRHVITDTAIAIRSAIPTVDSIGGVIFQKGGASFVTGDIASFFTLNGVSASVSGGKINVTATAGNYNSSIDLKPYTDRADWKMSVAFTVGTPGTTTFGAGTGIRSTNTHGTFQDVKGWISLSTLGTSGQMNLAGDGSTGTVLGTATPAVFTITAGHRMLVTTERIGYNVMTTARDLTANSAPIYNYFSYTPATTAPNNTGRFAFFVLGTDTYAIDSISVTTTETQGLQWLLVGDSKYLGSGASSFVSNLSGDMLRHIPSLGVSAGGNDMLEDIILKLPEIISRHPYGIIFGGGSNSVRFGDDSATTATLYDTCIARLTRAGIRVIHAPMYEAAGTGIGVDLSKLYNHILQTYPGSIAPTFPVLQAVGALNTDGTHPTDYGYSSMENVLLPFMGVERARNTGYAIQRQIDKPQTGGFWLTGAPSKLLSQLVTGDGVAANIQNIINTNTSGSGTMQFFSTTGGTPTNFIISGNTPRTSGYPIGMAGSTTELGYYTGSYARTFYITSPGTTTIGTGIQGNVQLNVWTAPDAYIAYYGNGGKTFLTGNNIARTAGRQLSMGGSCTDLGYYKSSAYNITARFDSANNVIIGDTVTKPSAILSTASTAKGVLFSPMTTTQMGSISSPATGLMVWNTDSLNYCVYNGTAWRQVSYTATGSSFSTTAAHTWTNTNDFTGATVTVATQTAHDSTIKDANTLYVDRAVAQGLATVVSGSTPTLQQVFNVGGGGKAFLTKSDTASGLSTNSLLLDSFPSVVIRANTFSDIEHIGTTARIAVYANTAQLNGALNVATIAINSSFTASQSLMPVQHVDLTAPSSNSTITLGSVATYIGYQWKFVNRNTTSFTWSFAGVALKDASGNTVTSFPNGYAYEIYCDGTNWLLKNATYVGAGPTGIPIAGSYSSTGTATTTFTVTIGITEPTTTYKVGFAPTDALAAGLYYITNKTATTFDVVYLSGLTGTVSFDWTITP